MGRRKIEIKAIKDDRNRSVTFLKRKGGLFKKAHELSVLCSVDVAVIIFGNNKKLYEYSSSDIGEILNRYQFYGGANEHKGPADFNGKKDDDDDDDDDMGTPPQDLRMSQDPQMMPPHYQHQPTNQFQHIRHHTPSASPPIPNGIPFHHPQQRQHTPQPHQISRPASRNDGPRRVSSNLSQHHGMPQVSGPPQAVNGFTYVPNPPVYNPHGPQMPPGMPQHQQQPPPPQHHQQQQQPSYQYPAPPPPPQHMQQVYMEEARRQSMPPAFPQVERAASIPTGSPPQPQPPVPQNQQQAPQSKQDQSKQENRQQMLEPIKRASKSRSIFTPIDEDRSVLSKHWASSTTAAEQSQTEPINRSQSVDVAAVSRNANGAIASPPSPPRTAKPPSHKKDRNVSMSSIDFQPPSRTNSGMSQLGPNAKRPRLKVQIPDEPSDNDSQTAGSGNSAQGTSSSNPSRPNAGTDSSHSGGPSSTMGIMTLPPPSPSTSTIQSAGATGPPNPFARPLPPSTNNSSNSNPNQTNQNNTNGNTNRIQGSSGGLPEIETPVSALPSRFMNNEFLPSPSSFYPDWFSRRGNDSAGGMGMDLQSPLNFATPVVGSGPSFLRDEKEKEAATGTGAGGLKRKSPDGEEGAASRGDEAKKVKHEA